MASADPDRPGHPAAYAANWRTVLLVDVGVGAAGMLAGFVLMGVWNLVFGAGIASLALVYVLLVARRWRQWAALRRDAGLDGGPRSG